MKKATRHPDAEQHVSNQGIQHEPLTVQSLQGQNKYTYGQTAGCAAAFTAGVKGMHYTPAPRIKATPFFLNHANCYRRLSKELSRYCVASMSQHNPNRNTVSDFPPLYTAASLPSPPIARQRSDTRQISKV